MKLVSFKVSKRDMALITRIADDRFDEERKENPALREYQRQTLVMDLTATRANGCPMDFARLLKAPAFDFLHDLYGIYRHLDRETGKLMDSFLPRCSR